MTKYQCHNREPFASHYFATGSDKPIPHVLTTDCQYHHTDLGKADAKCNGCKHKETQK